MANAKMRILSGKQLLQILSGTAKLIEVTLEWFLAEGMTNNNTFSRNASGGSANLELWREV